MLGKLGAIGSWQWSAWGKHPNLTDYFQVGENSTLGEAFKEWVEKGYEKMLLERDMSPSFSSWRFWIQGMRRGILVCGLLRKSSDRLGRRYPLAIVGTGSLQEWEQKWDLLPSACEGTWEKIERYATHMASDLYALKAEIAHITPPSFTWPACAEKREHGSDLPDDSDPLEERIREESNKRVIEGSLDGEGASSQFSLICKWHRYLKKYLPAIPNAVFMGGSPEAAYVVVFTKPLIGEDFSRLFRIQ